MVSTTAIGRLADEIARAFGHEDDGEKGDDEDGGVNRDGERDLTGRFDRRVAPLVAVAQEAFDILHDHDAVVHEQAEGDDHPDDAELVDGEAEEVEQEESDGDGERNGDHHDQRGARAERQERDQHEQDGDAEVAGEVREATTDVVGLDESLFQADAFGQAGDGRVDERRYFLLYLENVGAILSLTVRKIAFCRCSG